MLPRIATLAFAVSCLCCAKESTQANKTADSSTIAQSAAAGAGDASASPPATVAVARHLDTGVPAMSLDTMPWTDTKEVFDTTDRAPNFQCAPRIFTPADTLTLRIAVPHGDWLTVRRPDETTFNIVSPATPGEPNYSVMPSDSFKGRLITRFSGDIRSRALAAGHENVEPIFGQSGRYTFLVGENLQGNRGRDVRECTLRLVPLSKY
jgi:hypothetical protein